MSAAHGSTTATAPSLPPVRSPARARSRGLLPTGTWPLLRLALRQDRVMLPAWAGLTALTVLSMPGSLSALYTSAAERADMARSATVNSSFRALYGPVFSDSVGGLTAWRIGVYAALAAATMSLLLVVRHTRDEEETGRLELLSSAQVARTAPLAAALLTALIGNAAITLLVTVGLAGQGAAGALALGAAIGGTGLFFAGVAAITAQLTESGRLAKGLAGGVLGLAFLLRAAGDSASATGSSALTWASPLGWAAQLRPWGDAGERWWTLLPLLAGALLLVAVAHRLSGRRDVGMSFLPARPGRAHGRLGSATGLALRLQRGSVLGWALGFLLAGLVLGGITDGAADLVGDSARTREIFERMGGQQGLKDSFLAAMVSLLGMVAALFGVAAVLRLHGEETAGRAEPLLAAPVGRLRWAAGHLLVGYAGAALLMGLGGLGLALSYGHDLAALLGAALAQLPAIWVLTSVAVLLHGCLPKAAPAAWAVAGLCLVLGWLGPALNLPDPVLKLSPFTHLPKLPGPAMDWPPALILTVLTAALTTAGLAGLRHRDLLT